MVKSLVEINTEKLVELVDEIISIISERTFNANMERAEMVYEVGRAVIDKPYYKKNTPAARKIIEKLAELIGKSDRWIYLAVQFAGAYASFEAAVQTLDPGRKGLTFRNIASALPEPKDLCEHTQTVKEEWIIKKCRSCGYIINRERR